MEQCPLLTICIIYLFFLASGCTVMMMSVISDCNILNIKSLNKGSFFVSAFSLRVFRKSF